MKVRVCDTKGMDDGTVVMEVKKEEKGYKGGKNQDVRREKWMHTAYIIKAAAAPVDLGCFVSVQKCHKTT